MRCFAEHQINGMATSVDVSPLRIHLQHRRNAMYDIYDGLSEEAKGHLRDLAMTQLGHRQEDLMEGSGDCMLLRSVRFKNRQNSVPNMSDSEPDTSSIHVHMETLSISNNSGKPGHGMASVALASY